MAFHIRNCVGIRDDRAFAVQWLACALPCRRFTPALADDGARLRAGVDRYSFTVRDLHPLLLAGLPAHSENLHRSGSQPFLFDHLVDVQPRSPRFHYFTRTTRHATSCAGSAAVSNCRTTVAETPMTTRKTCAC